jgi:hypothetical protein
MIFEGGAGDFYLLIVGSGVAGPSGPASGWVVVAGAMNLQVTQMTKNDTHLRSTMLFCCCVLPSHSDAVRNCSSGRRR